jgi:hypothetical protein
MRMVAALLLLASCATSPSTPPSERVAGCWIARDGANATTMRWFPGADGAFNGELLRYTAAGAGEHESYVLRPSVEGWELCQTMSADASQCWFVAQGTSGSLEGGRAFIDSHRDRLRIAIVNEGEELVLFQGNRDGCD